MDTTQIDVRYHGNEQISWVPHIENSAATELRKDEVPSISSEDLRRKFVAFVRAKIQAKDAAKENTDLDDADDKKTHYGILALALDPSSELGRLTPEYVAFCQRRSGREPSSPPDNAILNDIFKEVFFICYGTISELGKMWFDGKQEEETDKVENDDSSSMSTKRAAEERSAANKNAQRRVPAWYGGCCIFSGFTKPKGAHIVPARAIHDDDWLHDAWRLLRLLWPFPTIRELALKGRETQNILPLSPNACSLWDRYMFAIRPISHHDDPEHRMFLQMVWLKDLDVEGSLMIGDWEHYRYGGVVDFRRGGDHNMYPAIQHGDVYELVTTDPELRPLPNHRLLEMQFGMHKLLGGMKATGALRSIFGGDLPGDPGSIHYDVDVPADWEFLLEAALDENMLNRESADVWTRALKMRVVRKCKEYSIPLRRCRDGVLVVQDSSDEEVEVE